jgi:hypothetical protein
LRYELKQAELKLKEEMVQRGMSPEDIVRVLQASKMDEAREPAPEPPPRERAQKVGQSDYFGKG